MILATTFLDYCHGHLNNRGKWGGSCNVNSMSHARPNYKIGIYIIGEGKTCESEAWNNLSIFWQNFLKSIAAPLIWMETEDILIMCWCWQAKKIRKKQNQFLLYVNKKTSEKESRFFVVFSTISKSKTRNHVILIKSA
jgi:hypothetical protein